VSSGRAGRRATAGRRARLALLPLALATLTACGPSPAPSPRPLVTGTPAVGATRSPAPAPTPPAPSTSPLPASVPLAPPPPSSSAWVGPIYPPRAHGYDVSYPQCSSVQKPAGAGFAIVGVNAGRAFTSNPCLDAEWRAAAGPRAVYFNSGYDPDNAAKTTADCRSRAQLQDGPDERRSAYAIGCSEAVYSMGAMAAAGTAGAAMIWIDVESSNSWDAASLDLNRTALQAEVDQLAAYGRLVGLYGTFDEWQGIVGDWSPAGVVADWVAGRPVDSSCGAPGFSGHPVWLAQETAPWTSGADSDWAC
jgi:hypothetical protein